MESYHDQPVIAHKLCLCYQKLLRQNKNFEITRDNIATRGREDTRPSDKYDLWVDKFEHYPDVWSLFRSAEENNCHLCSILVDHIFAYYGDHEIEQIAQRLDSSEPKQLYALTYDLSFDRQPGCTEFQVHLWEHPVGERETLSVIEVHRHLKDSFSTQRECGSLLEREGDWPEEAEYRWSTSTGSDAAFKLIQKWLENCLTNHNECGAKATVMRPTRLLDVDDLGTDDIKLVPGDCAKNEPYATLSYCWGPIKPLMLERCNYEEFTRRIEWRRLPKTMQDAVTVCCKLSIRYLWVDALCIIQGSDGDFETEAPRMEAVYGGSLFTIAAADSEDSNGGCFQDRFPLMREDLRIAEDDKQITFARARPSCKFYGNLPGHCVLDTRGWVFQERILSPRTLYFGQRGLHMECRTGMVCEYSPESHRDKGLYRKVEPLKNIYSTIRSLGEAGVSEEARQVFKKLWTGILTGYTRTNLSHPVDRLSALAGISTLVNDSLAFEASFGLWLPIFIDELLWRVIPKYDGRDWSTHGFSFIPTWSWTNVNASVENALEDTKALNKLEDLGTLHSAKLQKLPPPTPFIQLPTLGARFPRPPPITLCGMLTKCWARPYQPEFGYPLYDLQPEEDGVYANRKRCTFHPDLAMTEDTMGLYCLLIKREHRRKHLGELQMTSLWDFGLVLKPTAPDTLQFRRVGLYHEKMIDSMCSWPHQPAIMDRVRQFDHDELDEIERMKLFMIMFPNHTKEETVEIF